MTAIGLDDQSDQFVFFASLVEFVNKTLKLLNPSFSFVNTPRFENKSKKYRYFLVLVKAEKIAVQSCN